MANLVAVSGELVREVQGRIVFGDAVSKIADCLSPLGAAARIVAEAGAVTVELRRLSLEGRQIEADRLESMARLGNRRSDASHTIGAMRQTADGNERTAQRFRACITNMERKICEPGISLEMMEVFGNLMRDFAAQLVDNTAKGGQVLTGQIHEILNGEGALDPRQPRPSRLGRPQEQGAPTRGRPGRR
jgi:hypothetical protein